MSADSPGPRGAILVFAKAPRAGGVKTRFCPPLSAEQAAGLYACLLDDVLDATVRMAAKLRLAAFLCVDPWSARGAFEKRLEALATPASTRFQLLEQRGADLGARMGDALARVASLGHRPLLLRGSDSPTLGLGELRAALRSLGGSDLVVRPDRDGGYSLLGLREAPPGDLFQHPMSHPDVLAQTLSRARARGLAVHQLAPGFDLDSMEDLAALAALRREGQAGGCLRTLAYLDALGVWGR